MDVLFDLDGVLVHPRDFRRLLESDYGIGPETTRTFFQTRFVSCLRGEADLVEELPPYLEEWGWPDSADEFVRIWFEVESTPIHDVLAFVTGLRVRGLRCHIASNQERHRARYLAETMGFRELFDSLHFSCDLGVVKPDLAYYGGIEAALGRGGSDLLFIDDNVRNVEAARTTGWRAVHFLGPESLDEVTSILDAAAG